MFFFSDLYLTFRTFSLQVEIFQRVVFDFSKDIIVVYSKIEIAF